MFHEDPIEFIRKQADLDESMYMPKLTTIELIERICSHKSQKGRRIKPDHLMPFLNFASNNMQQYADEVAAGANPDWRVKEALLFSVGSLQGTIEKHADLAASIEPMLKAHVFPDFTSSQPLL